MWNMDLLFACIQDKKQVNVDHEEYDPGVVITLGTPDDIHNILALPAVRLLHVPPAITPPAVALQQGKTSSIFRGAVCTA